MATADENTGGDNPIDTLAAAWLDPNMTLSHVKFALYGFAAGLVVAALTWLFAWWKHRALQGDLKVLRRHLHTQMEISQEGAENRREALNELRRQNENLRVTVKALSHKPGRKELRQLAIYDHALHLMLARAPGFSMAWEAALGEAEQHHAQVDEGLIGFAKRLVLPSQKKDPKASP